ncbi:putative polygalacturonase [Acorus gramineus]|uniref:Polygalacturonase n=1 Tax=Acorus gramineus TaxID=55184 RepID=A0AAV9A4K8_ACOGR|nr:putative polygalacturonase [Acorus gramineus]
MFQGAGGFARDITFEHLQFTNVQNPIIIDQFYCDRANMSSCRAQVNYDKTSLFIRHCFNT